MLKSFNKPLLVIFLGIVMTMLSFVSCGSEESDTETKKAITEGKITYSISYPYYTDEFMVVLLPDVMTMEFKNNVYKNTVTKGGLFTTTIISDCNKKELVMTLDFGSKRLYARLDEGLVDTMLLDYAVPDLLEVDNLDSILGMDCQKFMAVYESLEDGYDCEIFTSDEVGISNSNWWTPFGEVENVMLGYEMAQYGLVTRFVADSISEVSIPDETFQIPEGFKEVSLEQMLFQLNEIFKQIIE